MPVADRRDPFRAFNFLVEIDGITRAGFQECSGLDVSLEPVEYREGGEPITPRKLSGLAKYSNITLKRGMTDDQELWEWIQRGVDGTTERKNGSVILLDDKGEERARWSFRDGWPSKWEGPSFNATDNSVAVETLEIAHEGVTVV